MAQYLWGFNSSATTGGTTPEIIALPNIKPTGALASNYAAPKTTSLTNPPIDVVRDFYWTYSPVGDIARAETPTIILTERKLRTNALVSQLKYSLGQAYSGGQQTLQNLNQINKNLKLTQFLSSLIPDAAKNFINGAATAAAKAGSGVVRDANSKVQAYSANSDTVQGFNNVVKSAGAQIKDTLNTTFADDNNPTVNSSPWLAPYRNLYLTDPTGWVYKLPYFTNNQATQGNSFSDSGGVGTSIGPSLIGAGADIATSAAGILASLNNPAQITYIEKTKFYNYPTEGEDITVEFPLINTGQVTYDDVVKNWQFLFLLLYQNRPGKTSANTVDQPVIYQVEIPGVKYFPYCSIQSLNIEFMGSRRELNINIPAVTTVSSDSRATNNANTTSKNLTTSVGYQSIPTIIPDAYKVTIVLKSLVANSKNFMQHMIGPHNLVETGTSTKINAALNAPGGLPAAAAAASPLYAATHASSTNFGLDVNPGVQPSANTLYPSTGLGPLAQ
jgi:hypothetical protein